MLSAKTPLIYTRFAQPLRILSGVIAVVLAIIIAQQSLTLSNAQGSVQHLDKLVHFLAYGMLGVFALPALPRVAPVWVIAGLGLLGGLIEVGQGVMGLGRTPDILDAASNLSGAVIALVFWRLVTKSQA